MRLLLAMLAVLTMLAAPASRAQQAAEAPKLQLIGHYGGSITAVALRPPYAYVGVGNSLEVLDISDTAAPRRVSTTPLPRQVHAIALQGDYAYLMGEPILREAGLLPLMVIDIARLEYPRLLTTQMPEEGFGGSITVAGRYAYISGSVVPGGPGQVRVLDLAAPAAPQVLPAIGDLAGQTFAETAVAGPFLYAAAGSRGLRIYDVADPREANELGVFTPADPNEGVIAVEAAGSYVYTLNMLENAIFLRVFDVSDPGAPQLRGSLGPFSTEARIAYGTAPGGAPRIYLSDSVLGNLWVARLHVVDVSAPSAPRTLGFHDFPASVGRLGGANVFDLAAAPGLVAAAAYRLALLATVPEAAPELRGSYAPLPSSFGLAQSGDQVLLESPGQVSSVLLTPVDVSDPTAPQGDGPLTEVGGSGSVLIGDRLYVPEFTALPGLGIYTRSADGSFARAGGFETAGVVRALAVRGTTAFLIDEVDGLVAVDVADPAAPARLDVLPLQTTTTPQIVIDGERAYVPTCESDLSGAVSIVDISDPSALAPLGAVSRSCNGTVVSIAAQGATLYLHESFCVTFSCSRSLLIVDVTDPAAPRERGRVEIGAGFPGLAYAVSGYVLLSAGITARFILDYSGEIALVDVSDPAQPRLIEKIELSSPIADMAIVGPLVYAVAEDSGLSVLRAAPLFAPTERLYLPLARR